VTITRSTVTDVGAAELALLRGIDEPRRTNPDDALAAEMRRRFPTEREYDEMLSRKLVHRRAPRRRAAGLDDLAVALDAFLRHTLDGDFTVSRQRWLAGGASKLQMAFRLNWDDPENGRTDSDLVLRMEPQEGLNATSRRREFQLLRALAGTVPVPRVHWVDHAGTWFPEPALIYAFAEGVTKPRTVERGRATGVGNPFYPELREALAPQFIEPLARIHTFDHARADLSAFDVPGVGTTQSALWQLNRARRVWEEDRAEDLPVLEVVASWLERNLPMLDRVSLVHGDYRAGNFLFDENSRRITAWLDVERGHLGDRHRDLAWITMPHFGNYDADGRLLVSGLVPIDEFYSSYEAASGLTVDLEQLRFYQILNGFQLVVSSLGTAQRVVRLGRSHQDVLLSWLEGVVYSILAELRTVIGGDL
jgi:aminoglycoside phosphotransferase (APT) family kinase protein